MYKFKKEEIMLLIIECLKISVGIFTGPFLVAFFIKSKIDNIYLYAFYNIVAYASAAIFSFIVSAYIKRRNKMFALRLGIVSNIIYLLLLLYLSNKIINYTWVIGLFYGLGLGSYYMPYNYLIANEIRDNKLKSWYGYKTAISNTLQVIIPLVVGFLLMKYNYSEVAILFVVIQLINLFLSFTFKVDSKKTTKFSIKKYKEAIKNHGLERYFKVNHMIEFLTGFAISNSALGTLITLYVVKMFKTNSNLGIFTSIFMMINVILSYLFATRAKECKFGKYMFISGTLITISILLFMFKTNKFTLILYNLVYNVGAAMMVLIVQILNMKVAKYKVIKRNYQLEHLSVREFYLCLGRVVGFSLLIIAGLFKEEYLFKILILIYSISFLLLSAFTLKHLKEEEGL